MRRLLLVSLLAFPLSGCAALLSGGPSQIDVSIEDPQENVEVLVEGTSNGHQIRRKVPFFTVSLDRHSDYTLKVHGRGYRSTTHPIGRSAQPHVLGDLFLLGLGAYGVGYGLANPNDRIERLGGIPVLSLGAGVATVGLIGLGWDAVTGNLWRHTPSQVVVSLDKEPARPWWPLW